MLFASFPFPFVKSYKVEGKESSYLCALRHYCTSPIALSCGGPGRFFCLFLTNLVAGREEVGKEGGGGLQKGLRRSGEVEACAFNSRATIPANLEILDRRGTLTAPPPLLLLLLLLLSPLSLSDMAEPEREGRRAWTEKDIALCHDRSVGRR